MKDIGSESRAGESCSAGMKKYPMFFVNYIMGLVMPNQSVKENRAISTANRPPENRGLASVFTYLPLTSKVFYYMMIRDYISKKISYPFFLVAHCMIVLDSGWDKLPILPYLGPMRLCINVLVPRHRCD